jgi:hypothetical protein
MEAGEVDGVPRPQPVAFRKLSGVEHQGFVHLNE